MPASNNTHTDRHFAYLTIIQHYTNKRGETATTNSERNKTCTSCTTNRWTGNEIIYHRTVG